MKPVIFIALAVTVALASGSASAQATSTQPLTSKAITQGKLIRPAVKVPESLRPSAAARVSTAQGAAARGQKPGLKTLPEFSVRNRNELVVSSQTLTQKGHWLLVYRRDECVACDRLMNVLAAGASVDPDQGKTYAIVVAGKEPDGLAKVRTKYSTLTNANWVSDKDEVALKALNIHGAPVVFGMDGTAIKWMVPGNLGNPTSVEHMAATWVAAGPASSTVALSQTLATGR
jgi:hypothetical protein